LKDLYNVDRIALDPGDAGTIRAIEDMKVTQVVTATAETRTLARPLKAGIHHSIVLHTDGGDLTLTVTGGYNPQGSTTLTFDDAGDYARFESIDVGGTLRWQIITGPSIAVVGETLADDELLSFGTGTDARFSWDTTDANANELLLQMPAGTGTNVPVLVIGQSVESVDLGLYNGVVDPRIAMFGVGAVTTGCVFEFRKARGSVASPTVCTTGDDLGTVNFYGCVAAGEYVLSASIRADIAGTVATTRGPGNLSFNVATDAAPSVLTERLLLTASGAITLTAATDVLIANGTGLVVGHTAQETVSTGDGATDLVPEVQVLGTTQADSSILLATFSATATRAAAPTVCLAKGGNAAIGSHTIVTADEILGSIIAFGDDGVDLEAPAASIQFAVDGTPGAGDMPGRIEFHLTTDGGETLAEKWRMTEDGVLTSVDGTPANAATTDGAILATGGMAFTDVANAWIDDSTHGNGTVQHFIGNETIDTTASDERLKDVHGSTKLNGLATVRKWADELVDFEWKSEGNGVGEFCGLIAQRFYEVAPHLVRKPEDPDSTWTVRYQYIVPYLMKAISELADLDKTRRVDKLSA
jgi:hypothetical protein